MADVLKNYKQGALWKTRQDIDAYTENNKPQKIKKNKIILILKIVEEFTVTHVKFLYSGKIYYAYDIEDVCLNFFYEDEKVL